MNTLRCPALVARLSDHPRLLEVGVGRRTGVAAGLVAAGADVRATDVVDVDVPEGVRFRREDVTDVDPPEVDDEGNDAAPVADEFYRVDAVYALNCPPELHRPILDLAASLSVPFYFTTLGHDQPAIPVDRETLTDEEGRAFTLFVADASHPSVRRGR